MGCSNSSQTSAVDTTRPSAKPEESNGTSTTGVAGETGKGAEDTETIPDQTPAGGGDAKPEDEVAPSPPAGEESPPSADTKAAEEDVPAEAAPGDNAVEAAQSSSEAEQEAAGTVSEPEPEEAPAPSE